MSWYVLASWMWLAILARAGVLLPEDVWLPPRNSSPTLKPLAVIFNPGGFVAPEKYKYGLEMWQDELVEKGYAVHIVVCAYLFNLPLPINMYQRFLDIIDELQIPEGAPVFVAGHSMGGSVIQDITADLFAKGAIRGQIVLGSYLLRVNFINTGGSDYTLPTLTVGAELNFGSARIPRIAEAFARQSRMTREEFPVVLIKGMNHMQFASGLDREDLAPEISDESALRQVAQISTSFILSRMGDRRSAEVIYNAALESGRNLKPFVEAMLVEGNRAVEPNQLGVPFSNCPQFLCGKSEWVSMLQAELTPDLNTQAFFSDLSPYMNYISKISGTYAKIVVMVDPVDEGAYMKDTATPVAPNSYLVQFITAPGAERRDFCRSFNAKAYEWALSIADPHSRERFQLYGQELSFGESRIFQNQFPWWHAGQLRFDDIDGGVQVSSSTTWVDNRYYCRLLTPFRALEWIYVDGLKRNLFQKP